MEGVRLVIWFTLLLFASSLTSSIVFIWSYAIVLILEKTYYITPATKLYDIALDYQPYQTVAKPGGYQPLRTGGVPNPNNYVLYWKHSPPIKALEKAVGDDMLVARSGKQVLSFDDNNVLFQSTDPVPDVVIGILDIPLNSTLSLGSSIQSRPSRSKRTEFKWVGEIAVGLKFSYYLLDQLVLDSPLPTVTDRLLLDRPVRQVNFGVELFDPDGQRLLQTTQQFYTEEIPSKLYLYFQSCLSLPFQFIRRLLGQPNVPPIWPSWAVGELDLFNSVHFAKFMTAKVLKLKITPRIFMKNMQLEVRRLDLGFLHSLVSKYPHMVPLILAGWISICAFFGIVLIGSALLFQSLQHNGAVIRRPRTRASARHRLY